MPEHEALWWERENDRIRCLLCPRRCLIAEGASGDCGVRTHRGGRLYSAIYGEVSSAHLDPVEKKPLYHFHPGKKILSLGTWGCNLHCAFCQNWQISQQRVPTQYLGPAEAVELAAQEPGNVGIAFTYNEPLIWYEYVLDVSRAIRNRGLAAVLVTNGEIEEIPLRRLLPNIAAMNVDLKAMDEGFYRRICKGHLGAVLRTIALAREHGCHVEITNLLIPTLNDDDASITRLVEWVGALDPTIPLHFTRYHPDFQISLPPTPIETLKRAYRLARERLPYVYTGNVLDDETSATRCPKCKEAVIRRWGMGVSSMNLDGNRCGACGEPIALIR